MQGSFRLVSTRRASNHHQGPSLEALRSTVFLWRKIAAIMPAQALDDERVFKARLAGDVHDVHFFRGTNERDPLIVPNGFEEGMLALSA